MADTDKFEWALKNGDLDQVKLALKQEPGLVSAVGGKVPLCIAADYGQTEIITHLLGQGATVNVTDKYGMSPLLSAIYEGHTQSVKLLLSKGATKSGTAPDGSSYLECAENDEIRNLLK